jgi:serine/threonine-protein kinase HSL1 (negative regulator of Swe1 kinase)
MAPRVQLFIDLKPIAEGTNTRVYRARGVNNTAEYAVKEINLANASPQFVQRARQEAELLLELSGHPNVIKTREVYEENNALYMVMDYVDTDLLTYLSEFECGLSEKETCHLFRQLVKILKHLHSKNIVHGDIKLENILYDRKTQNLLLIDFGSASRVQSKSSKLQVMSGTPQYVAPEVILQEEYDGFKSDLYSLGVVLFALATNRLPFDDEDGVYYYSWVENYHDALFSSNTRLLPPCPLSRSLTSLIRSLLALNPGLRGNVNDILSHPWVKKNSIKQASQEPQKFNLRHILANFFMN